jgi:hypothetical protein
MWTEVYADTATKDGILDALVKGKSYAVHAPESKNDLKLESIVIHDDTVDVVVWGPVLDIQVYSKGHKLVDSTHFPRDRFKEMDRLPEYLCEFNFIFKKEYPYARIVIKGLNSTIYLNPIVRSVNGKTSGVERLVPEIDVTKTWFYRLCVLLIELLTLILFLYIWQLKPFKR